MKFSTSDFSFSDFSLLVFPGAKRRAAFTLIELLTVVAIIGILAGIVISGISGVRKKANQVRCLSNLRQVGVAIIAYANDNKDNLPGPTLLGASSTYTKTSKQYLGYHLASYVSMRRPEDLQTGETEIFPYLRCPQRVLANPDDSAPFFIVQCRVPTGRTSNGTGRILGQYNEPSPKDKPARYAELEHIGGPSRVWALVEADQGLGAWKTVKDSGWFNNLPVNPVHGGSRVVLFFDARVQLMKDLPPDPQ
ncbi:type II secretion system protein [Geminisphaera colitermitum]|uniref:type II secretion system protein n=1 Tax=Geminisphaera colitermitum TaxID=1148786 RepID=UPI000158D613|nr:type II secretion system protein [Geminisphaera colitermitum]